MQRYERDMLIYCYDAPLICCHITLLPYDVFRFAMPFHTPAAASCCCLRDTRCLLLLLLRHMLRHMPCRHKRILILLLMPPRHMLTPRVVGADTCHYVTSYDRRHAAVDIR